MERKQLTCIGTGDYNFDVVVKRNYPMGPEKQRKYVDEIMVQEVGGNCGNVMCELGFYGWKTFPVSRLNTSRAGLRMKADLERVGADTRFLSFNQKDDVSLFRTLHGQDKEGTHEMHFAYLDTDGRTLRRPNKASSMGFVDKEDVRFLDTLDFVPDVLFMGWKTKSYLKVAEALHAKGALVYFEANEPLLTKADLAYVACSDVVKFSREIVPDVSLFENLSDGKLFVQTLDEDGVRFKLGKGDWVKVEPIHNPHFVDPQGAGDWFSSTFINALGELDLLSVKKMTPALVLEAINRAQQVASRSVSYMGAKTLIYEEFPGKYAPGSTEDFMHVVTKEPNPKSKSKGGFSCLEDIPAKDYREYPVDACHAFRSDYDCVNGVEKKIKRGSINPLSNLYVCHMPFQGLEFNSVEQMYHYYKFQGNDFIQYEILQKGKPKGVMHLCSDRVGYPDHQRTRWMHMVLAMEVKYLYCKEFRDIVKASGELPLVETQDRFDIHGSTVRGTHPVIGGTFNGHSVADKFVGMNGVGRCIMAVREKFRQVDVEHGYDMNFQSLDQWWNDSPVYQELIGDMGK